MLRTTTCQKMFAMQTTASKQNNDLHSKRSVARMPHQNSNAGHHKKNGWHFCQPINFLFIIFQCRTTKEWDGKPEPCDHILLWRIAGNEIESHDF